MSERAKALIEIAAARTLVRAANESGIIGLCKGEPTEKEWLEKAAGLLGEAGDILGGLGYFRRAEDCRDMAITAREFIKDIPSPTPNREE